MCRLSKACLCVASFYSVFLSFSICPCLHKAQCHGHVFKLCSPRIVVTSHSSLCCYCWLVLFYFFRQVFCRHFSALKFNMATPVLLLYVFYFLKGPARNYPPWHVFTSFPYFWDAHSKFVLCMFYDLCVVVQLWMVVIKALWKGVPWSVWSLKFTIPTRVVVIHVSLFFERGELAADLSQSLAVCACDMASRLQAIGMNIFSIFSNVVCLPFTFYTLSYALTCSSLPYLILCHDFSSSVSFPRAKRFCSSVLLSWYPFCALTWTRSENFLSSSSSSSSSSWLLRCSASWLLPTPPHLVGRLAVLWPEGLLCSVDVFLSYLLCAQFFSLSRVVVTASRLQAPLGRGPRQGPPGGPTRTSL